MHQLTTDPVLADRITVERPPHRLERLRSWMTSQDVDCSVVFGADNVNYLGGYWRYYGGPSALVVDADGDRTLLVMRDEVRVAERLGEADDVRGYGERGFDYVGDHAVDAPVWARARRGFVKAPSAALSRRLARAGLAVAAVGERPRGARAYLKALRPHQWLKNALVFAPALAGHAGLGASAAAPVPTCAARGSAGSGLAVWAGIGRPKARRARDGHGAGLAGAPGRPARQCRARGCRRR